MDRRKLYHTLFNNDNNNNNIAISKVGLQH